MLIGTPNGMIKVWDLTHVLKQKALEEKQLMTAERFVSKLSGGLLTGLVAPEGGLMAGGSKPSWKKREISVLGRKISLLDQRHLVQLAKCEQPVYEERISYNPFRRVKLEVDKS